MRVLYLIPRPFLPPFSGNAHLTYNLLLFLTRKLTCDLTILVESGDSQRVIESIREALPTVNAVKTFQIMSGLEASAQEIGDLIFRGIPPSVSRYAHTDLQKWLVEQVSSTRYDIVHFDMFHMIPYIDSCRGVPTVLMSSDAYSMAMRTAKKVIHKPSQRLALFIRKTLFRRLEQTAYRSFTKVCTVSDVDSEYLRRSVPGLDVETVGIPVSDEFLQLGRSVPDRVCDVGSPSLLCVGNFDNDGIAHEAINFLDNVYCRLACNTSSPPLTVLGKGPSPALQRRLRRFPHVRHVEYAESYAGFLAQDWVYIYPQRCGSGVQVKVQQAMAVGLPVVGFRTAFGGLGVQNGVHCFMCDSDEEMRVRLDTLLANPSLRQSMGQAAAEHMRRMFSLEKVGTRMLEVYEKTVAKHRANASPS